MHHWHNESQYITYEGGRQLQHHKNVNSRWHQSHYDCSLEEMTLFQYTMHAGILDQSLVQRLLGRQQQLLYKENSSMIYCILSVKSKYLQCYKHKQFVLLECPSAPKAMVATTCNFQRNPQAATLSPAWERACIILFECDFVFIKSHDCC